MQLLCLGAPHLPGLRVLQLAPSSCSTQGEDSGIHSTAVLASRVLPVTLACRTTFPNVGPALIHG